MKRRALGSSVLLSMPLLLSLALVAACESGSQEALTDLGQTVEAVATKVAEMETILTNNAFRSNDVVHIELRGAGSTTTLVDVEPRRKRACRPPESNCAGEVRWVLAGHLPQNWTVAVSEKTSVEPTDCFQDFVLENNKRSETQTPAQSCQETGKSWQYDVILRNAAGTTVPPPIDPLVVMTWAP
jgi:hypothetical protein